MATSSMTVTTWTCDLCGSVSNEAMPTLMMGTQAACDVCTGCQERPIRAVVRYLQAQQDKHAEKTRQLGAVR